MEIKTLKNAIDRLAYTTSNGNKSNETDVTALNKIIDFVNNANEKVVNENQLYCKLYADALIENFRYYNYIEIANKKINKSLNESIEIKIMKLAFELQTDYLTDYFENKGLKEAWCNILFRKDIICLKTLKNHFEKNKENIFLINENNKEIYSKIDFKEFQDVYNFWTFEKVFELFQTNASISFNKFKNKN
jgi:hypothetical protein